MKPFNQMLMVCSISGGEKWFERKAVQGRCLLIAGKGGSGVSIRIDAHIKKYRLYPDTPVHVISDNANLFKSSNDVFELESIVRKIQPRLIGWDTLSQHAGGVSKNTDEMNTVLINMWKISDASGAANIIIGHPGKAKYREQRGCPDY